LIFQFNNAIKESLAIINTKEINQIVLVEILKFLNDKIDIYGLSGNERYLRTLKTVIF
jgi:hypothetical protein